MTEPTSQGAGNPSDEQELDPSELTDEELRSYFTGDANSEETPASDEPETATQEDTEVGNTTEEPTDTEEEDEQERLSKMRVRPKDDVDQQILDLYKSEGFHGTLTEATRTIKGESTPVEPAQAQASSEAPDRTQAALSEIDTKIAELNGKAKEASEDLDTAQAFALQGEIMEQRLLKIKLEGDADREKEREQARLDNAYRQKAVESRDKAFKRFPVLQDSDSVQRKQFDAFVTKKQNDPDYATVFESPKWVELMANEFAGEVELTPPSADVSVENLNRPSRNNTKVLTSASNTSTVSKQKQITPQGVRDSMHRLDRDTLYSMLGQE